MNNEPEQAFDYYKSIPLFTKLSQSSIQQQNNSTQYQNIPDLQMQATYFQNENINLKTDLRVEQQQFQKIGQDADYWRIDEKVFYYSNGSQSKINHLYDFDNRRDIIYKKFNNPEDYEQELKIYNLINSKSNMKQYFVPFFSEINEKQIIVLSKGDIDLDEFSEIKFKNEQRYEFHELLIILTQIITVMQIIQQEDLYYQDMKPHNIILFEDKQNNNYFIKFCDVSTFYDYKDKSKSYGEYITVNYFDNQYIKIVNPQIDQIVQAELYAASRTIQSIFLRSNNRSLQTNIQENEKYNQENEKLILSEFEKFDEKTKSGIKFLELLTDMTAKKFKSYQEVLDEIKNIQIKAKHTINQTFLDDKKGIIKKFQEDKFKLTKEGYWNNQTIDSLFKDLEFLDSLQKFHLKSTLRSFILSDKIENNPKQYELDSDKYHTDLFQLKYDEARDFLFQGQYNKSEDEFKKALEQTKHIQNKDNLIKYKTKGNIQLGRILIKKGDYTKAKKLFEQIYDDNLKKKKKKNLEGNSDRYQRDRFRWISSFELAKIYLKFGKQEESQQKFDEAIKIQKQLKEKDDYMVYLEYGNFYQNYKEYDKAEQKYEEAKQIIDQIKGSNSLQLAEYYKRVANIRFIRAQYTQSLTFYDKAIEEKMKILKNENHIELEDIYHGQGTVYQKNNDNDKALQLYEKSIKINDQHFSQFKTTNINNIKIQRSLGNINNIKIYSSLGIFYSRSQTKDLQKAKKFLKKGLTLSEEYFGEKNHYLQQNLYQTLAKVYSQEKKFKYAENCLKNAKQIYKKICKYTQSHQDDQGEGSSKGSIYYSQGDLKKSQEQYKEAAKYYTKSLTYKLKQYGGEEKNSNIATLYKLIGTCYKEDRGYELALKNLKRSFEINSKINQNDNNQLQIKLNLLKEIFFTYKYLKQQDEEFPKLKIQQIQYQQSCLETEIDQKKLFEQYKSLACQYYELAEYHKNKKQNSEAINNYKLSREQQIIIQTKFSNYSDNQRFIESLDMKIRDCELNL